MLALHQFAASALAHNEIDASIASAATSLLDNVALAAKPLAHKQLELPPVQSSQFWVCRLRFIQTSSLYAAKI